MSAQAQSSGAPPVAVPRTPWKEVAAASIGNALEFYDLVVYAYFAVILSKLFFPTADQTVSLMLAFANFGISFVMRPFGAIVLGSYADRAGRKKSLTLSIAIIILGTAMLVFAPTYAQIGIASPLIVLVARLLQGFSTGGEFGAATAFMVEYATAGRRGYYASWQASTQGLATVLAAGIAALLSYTLTPEQLSAWGWRLAFSVGLLMGPVGFYIRSKIDETPEFKQAAAVKVEKSPLGAVLRRDGVYLLLGIGLVAGNTAFNYVHKTYMPTYALTQLHFPPTSSYVSAFVAGLAAMLTGPLFGELSDRYGRLRVLSIAFPSVCLTTYPLFLALNTWPTLTTLIAVQALVGMQIAACLGPVSALLAEIFPTRTRGIGLALSYNISVTVFGGFAPLIVTSMIAATGNKMAPAFYVMATGIISIIALVPLAHRASRRAGDAVSSDWPAEQPARSGG
jgi:MFS transporter, MHS family, proline/betaine transporter